MTSYANIIKKVVTVEKPVIKEKKTVKLEQIDNKISYRQCAFGIMYNPYKKSQCSYETWEYHYYTELENLKNIFCANLVQEYPELYSYFMSTEFTIDFFAFIYKTSSQYILPNMTPISEEEEDKYCEFMIKRNEYNE